MNDFSEGLHDFYNNLLTENMLDDILKKAVKEYDSKSWYQRFRDYIKKHIII